MPHEAIIVRNIHHSARYIHIYHIFPGCLGIGLTPRLQIPVEFSTGIVVHITVMIGMTAPRRDGEHIERIPVHAYIIHDVCHGTPVSASTPCVFVRAGIITHGTTQHLLHLVRVLSGCGT